jgi:hypothetical protein
MPEEERMATLNMLQQSRMEVQQMMEKLPLSAQSMAAQKRRKDLEDKMQELERSITTFSR